MRSTKPFAIVVSGPSGVGKTTVVDALLREDPLLKNSVSVTTRPPRKGEREGEAYFFVDEAAFDKLENGRLIEWATVHDHRYGTPREFVEKQLARGYDVVLNIDVQGGAQVRNAFPDAVLIFILPPSFEVLRKRVMHRGTDYERSIETRLDNARKEMELAGEYDYLVVNDVLGDAVAALKAIVRSERCRRSRYPKDFVRKLGE